MKEDINHTLAVADKSDHLEKKLRNLKKELKCWESMFFRSHGRKPGKDDIDGSGNEIRTTYKEYFHIRSKLSSTPVKEKQKDDSGKEDSSDGVFGSTLNKQFTEKPAEKPSGHLKERSLSKNTFIKKKHLRNPLEVNQENKDTPNEVKEVPTSLPDSKPEPNKKVDCDVNQENLVKDIIISSSNKTQNLNLRKLPKISARRKSALSRNYQLSKEWMERYIPRTEEVLEEKKISDTGAEPLVSGYQHSQLGTTDAQYTENPYSSAGRSDPVSTAPLARNTIANKEHISNGVNEVKSGTGNHKNTAGEEKSLEPIACDKTAFDSCNNNISSQFRIDSSQSSVEEKKSEESLVQMIDSSSRNIMSPRQEVTSSERASVSNPVKIKKTSIDINESVGHPKSARNSVSGTIDESDVLKSRVLSEPTTRKYGLDILKFDEPGSGASLDSASDRSTNDTHGEENAILKTPTSTNLVKRKSALNALEFHDNDNPSQSERAKGGDNVIVSTEQDDANLKKSTSAYLTKGKSALDAFEFDDSLNSLESKRINNGDVNIRTGQENDQILETPSSARPVKRKSALDRLQLDGGDSEKSTSFTTFNPMHAITPSQAKGSVTRKRKAGGGPTSTEADDVEVSLEKVAKKRKVESAKAAVADTKIPRGKRLVSENFVRIDITKKKFCRGNRRIKGSTYKRQQWKKKTQFNSSSASSSSKKTAKCFKCGKEGHWAKECAKRTFKGNMDRGSTFDGKKNEDFLPVHESDTDQRCVSFSLEDVPDLPRCWPRIPYQQPNAPSNVSPLFEAINGQPSREAISEVNKALRTLGYNSFRHGQESTVARIVSGLSTLLVLSTGSGKSLCYQLPAYLYYKKAKYLTLVISPLVALMEDQVGNLPYGLKGACFHNNMTKQQRDKVMKDIADGKIAILLLSPEALVAGSAATGYMPMLGSLPPIAFACIDEAHCVSEWSHNFRPNYLRVCKIPHGKANLHVFSLTVKSTTSELSVLREQLGVRCLLGLTATATKSTSMSITKHLLIDEGDSIGAIIRGETMPDNLHLTVSRDDDRDRALVQLLSGPRFEKCVSIIIYCTRREETERLSSMLRTCLQNLPPTELEHENAEENEEKKKPKRKGAKSKKQKIASVLWDAECYHAGMTPAQRRRVQKRFMSGELRIVVATTAFGMGLDKSDVRAIIHYNMPKSFESFLQEVGRAGRDGLPAHCHIFLDDEAKDLSELRRHTYSNTVDNKSVKRLVNKIFRSCDCQERSQKNNENAASKPRFLSTNMSCGRFPTNPSDTDDLLDDLTPEDFGRFDQEFDQSEPRKCIEEPMEVLGDDQLTPNDENFARDGNRLNDAIDPFAFDECDQDTDHQPLNQSNLPNGNKEPMPASVENHVELNNVALNVPSESIDKGDKHEADSKPSRYCSGHHVAFSIDDAVQDLDMPEENIATLLSYLELHPDSMIKLLNPVRAMCTVKCYGGPGQMKVLAKKFMPMTAVFNNLRRNELTLSDSRCISFNVVEVADEMGWDLDIVYRELRSIQWNTQFSFGTGDSSIGKSGVVVEFGDLSCLLISPGDLSNDERDHICKILSNAIQDQEQTRLLQLDALYNTLSQVSHDTYHAVAANHDPAADRNLRENVEQYFECDPADMKTLLKKLAPQNIEIPVPECKWSAISRDVRTMIGLHSDVTFTARSLARIFHGINSPCYPAIVWGRDRRFWRRYLDVDFNELRKFIMQEIIKYRS